MALLIFDFLDSTKEFVTSTLDHLQIPVKDSFEAVNKDLKEIYKGIGIYSKALEKVINPMHTGFGIETNVLN